jgi:hypothetical protein
LYQLEKYTIPEVKKHLTIEKKSLTTGFEDLYKDFNATVDEKVMEQLIELYATKSPKQFLPEGLLNQDLKAKTAEIFKTSKLTSLQWVEELINGDAKTVLKQFESRHWIPIC